MYCWNCGREVESWKSRCNHCKELTYKSPEVITKPWKQGIIFFLVISLIFYFAVYMCVKQDKQEEYQKGYDNGVEAGQKLGYEQGCDDATYEIERKCKIARNEGYAEGRAAAENESGVRYVEVPKFYSADQEEMYDEIWDEVYEQAYEDGYYDGCSDGYSHAEYETRDEVYEQAYDEGYSDGYSDAEHEFNLNADY